MTVGQKLWTRDELILAVNLYCKLPFGKMHKANPEIIKLAELIGRTPSSVGLKLVNFASFDPTLKERGIKGASNASKLDKQIWGEFYENWDEALITSEKLLAEKKNTSVEKQNNIDLLKIPVDGLERKQLIKTRVNQSIFRQIILATYKNKCCISGIDNPELLIASHIVPWSVNEKNRMNPMNGLLLNALHDKAFESGLITINADDYKIKISNRFLNTKNQESIQQNFTSLNGKEITLPDKFLPSKEFLKLHNETRFVG